MHSSDLPLHFQNVLLPVDHSCIDGSHSARTLLAWLLNMRLCVLACAETQSSTTGASVRSHMIYSRTVKRIVGMTEKLRELVEEFRTVVVGRSNLLDSILPPVVFVALNALLSLEAAVWGALLFGMLVVAVRLVRRQSLRYALGGLGGVILAVLVARLLGRAEGYFVPGIISSVVTIFVALASLIIRRPMVAWTSFIARRWPLDWYWHPRVRPAYSEVTWFWVLFFALRSLLQLGVLRSGSVELLALTSVLTGWPATITLLVVSYLYGTWRLQSLRGPSVEEFKNAVEPPWTGQRRGF